MIKNAKIILSNSPHHGHPFSHLRSKLNQEKKTTKYHGSKHHYHHRKQTTAAHAKWVTNEEHFLKKEKKKENDHFQTRAKTRAPRNKQTSVANIKPTVLERVCFVFAESSVGPKGFEPSPCADLLLLQIDKQQKTTLFNHPHHPLLNAQETTKHCFPKSFHCSVMV